MLLLLDVRHDLEDPKRFLGALELDDEGVARLTVLDEDARYVLETLMLGFSGPSHGKEVSYSPIQGAHFFDGVEKRWQRSTYYRAVRAGS
jgi:hypothetical protein